MLKQEVALSCPKVHIHIPSTKRFFIQNESYINGFSNSHSLSPQSPFETFKNQLQELKPQLGLRTQKSGFTRVCSSFDDCMQNQKLENTRPQFSVEQNDKYKIDLQRFLQLLQKKAEQSQKQQKQFAFNTKNILRNICNAQNQYILFHSEAQKIIDCHLKNDSKFKVWVNKLRFHTFEEFQMIWDNNKKNLFSKLYKRLCRKFYVQNAIPYIMNSRIKNKETKLAHIRYLYRFIEGLQNPSDFFYFKQKEKEKL